MCGAVAEWSKALAWKVSIRQKRIEGSNPSRSANSIFPDINYRTALGGVLSYIVKGAEPKAVTALGLNLKQPGGELWGKRSGTSENIGRTARSRD